MIADKMHRAKSSALHNSEANTELRLSVLNAQMFARERRRALRRMARARPLLTAATKSFTLRRADGPELLGKFPLQTEGAYAKVIPSDTKRVRHDFLISYFLPSLMAVVR